MVDRGLFEVTLSIINDAQVNVCEELASNISDLLVLCVELNSVFIIAGVRLTHFHVVHSDAVVGKRLTVDVTDGLAHLQELFILVHSLAVLAQVIVKNTS